MTWALSRETLVLLHAIKKQPCADPEGERGPDHPRGGVTLIFSYIRRLGSFFGVQNFEFQYFLGFSEK